MAEESPVIWIDSVTVTIHPSHRMDDAPDQMGMDCIGCGSCTCHGLAELSTPCSYVLDFAPKRREPLVPPRWENVYARVEPSHWFDDMLIFTVVYRTPSGDAYHVSSTVEKDELERDPSMFGHRFEFMIKQLESDLPPF